MPRRAGTHLQSGASLWQNRRAALLNGQLFRMQTQTESLSHPSPPLSPPTPFGGKRGRWILFAVLFASLSIATPAVIYLQASSGPSWTFDWRLLSPSAIGGSALLLLAYFGTDALRLRSALKAFGQTATAAQLGKLVFINLFVSNITPMASGGGLAQVWYLRREGVPIRAALAATTLRTTLAMAAIFVATPCILFATPQLSDNRLGAISAGALGVAALGAAAFGAIAALRPRWLAAALSGFMNLPGTRSLLPPQRRQRWQRRLARETLRFSGGLTTALSGRKADLLLAAVHTLLFLLVLFSFPYLILRALDAPAAYWLTVGLVTVSTFAMYFAPTPGGAGFAEGSFWLFFGAIAPASKLALVIMVWRALTIYLGMAIGLLVTLRELSRRKEQL